MTATCLVGEVVAEEFIKSERPVKILLSESGSIVEHVKRISNFKLHIMLSIQSMTFFTNLGELSQRVA